MLYKKSVFVKAPSWLKTHSIRPVSLEKQCFGLSFLIEKNEKQNLYCQALSLKAGQPLYELKPNGVHEKFCMENMHT